MSIIAILNHIDTNPSLVEIRVNHESRNVTYHSGQKPGIIDENAGDSWVIIPAKIKGSLVDDVTIMV